MNSLTDISSNRGDETSSSSSSTTGEILVRFYTNHENIRIPSEPIAVPSNINRIGLGAIITHLLGKETTTDDASSAPLSFEFTIAASQYSALKAQQKKLTGSTSSSSEVVDTDTSSSVLGRTLLRTTLRKYITALGLSLEDVISLEYGPAVQPPRPSQQTWKTPDWITSIICGNNHTVYTGLSNGTLMIGSYLAYLPPSIESSKTTVNKGSVPLSLPYAHTQTIASLSLFEKVSSSSSSSSSPSTTTLVTGGHDGIVKVWNYNHNNDPSSSSILSTNTSSSSLSSVVPVCEQQYELHGCTDRCDGVGIDPTTGNVIVGGDAHGNVYFWNIDSTNDKSKITNTDETFESTGKVGEKRSRSTSTLKNPTTTNDDDDELSLLRQPFFQAKGRHNDRVSGIAWLSSANVASASWDHTIAIWDVEETRPVPVTLLRCGKVITSVSSSPLGSLVATSHPDHFIRIWDSRDRSSTASTKKDNDEDYTTVTTEAIGLKSTLQGQSSWINSVSWCHNSAYYVSGIGYDGQALLWDIRAPNTPLYTLDSHTDKGLCITWSSNDNVILSGGADGQIRINSVQI